jgi:hypothetical protein
MTSATANSSPRSSGAASTANPEALAAQLVLLYDGSSVGARMDRDPAAAVTARTVAATLLDAATGPARAA